MTYLDEAIAASRTRDRWSTVLGDVLVILGALVAGLVTWMLWTGLGGVELAAESADGVRAVSSSAVTVASVVVAVSGVFLARLLVLLLPQGLRWWTVVACAVWLFSLLGVLGATTAVAGVGLASLHLVVGASVVVGVRRVHRDEPGPAFVREGRNAD